MKSRHWWATGLAVALAATWLLWVQNPAPSSPLAATPGVQPSPESKRPADRPVPDAHAQPLRSSAEFATWLAEDSPLRGAALDGDWGLDAQGKLRPSLALKRRFDQLLTLLGDATLEQLRHYIDNAVRAQAGPQTAAEILGIWQRYVQLVGTRFAQAVDPQDWRTWQAALSEQHRVRQTLLGPAWADAFYRDEEMQLTQQIQVAQTRHADAPPAVEPPLIRREELSPQQTQQLQAADAAWDQWKTRIADAQQAVAQIQQAPELSAPQREAAIQRWLGERFNANEQRRVRALIEANEPLP